MSDQKSPIVFYYPLILSSAGDFCRLLERRFRATGHDRPIEFKPWDCYAEEPGRDGDLFAYDGVVLSTLVNRGFLHRLPEVIDVSDVFDWIHSGSKVRRQLYGVPFMVCGSFLISRGGGDNAARCDGAPHRDDTAHSTTVNVRDLNVGITTSLLNEISPYLYIMAFCHDQGNQGRYLDSARHLEGLITTGYVDSACRL